MGLDVTFRQKRKIICPDCGKVVDYHDINAVNTGGRAWYPFLEAIGYYVPDADHDEWYGKDMILTAEQAHRAYEFARDEEVYNWHEVVGMIAVALCEKDAVAINADW
jgi:hypothetical protein